MSRSHPTSNSWRGDHSAVAEWAHKKPSSLAPSPRYDIAEGHGKKSGGVKQLSVNIGYQDTSMLSSSVSVMTLRELSSQGTTGFMGAIQHPDPLGSTANALWARTHDQLNESLPFNPQLHNAMLASITIFCVPFIRCSL